MVFELIPNGSHFDSNQMVVDDDTSSFQGQNIIRNLSMEDAGISDADLNDAEFLESLERAKIMSQSIDTFPEQNDTDLEGIQETIGQEISEKLLYTDISEVLLSDEIGSKDSYDRFVAFEWTKYLDVKQPRSLLSSAERINSLQSLAEERISRQLSLSQYTDADGRTFLDDNKLNSLMACIFGNQGVTKQNSEDVARWLKQGFTFNADEDMLWALLQFQGGPCGVLAAVQAWLLRQLVYASTTQCRSDDGTSEMNCMNHTRLRLRRSKNCMKICLIEAVGCILYLCAPRSQYAVAEIESTELIEFLANNRSDETCTYNQICKTWIRSFTKIRDVMIYLYNNYNILEGNSGVLSFVASVVLSAGINEVRGNMDDIESSLVGSYGHCSQELVNLLLTGKSTTNVFDGVKQLSDNSSEGSDDVLSFKGILKRPLIGYLSELECMGLCNVGNFYKFPSFPFWIIGSPNHYSLFFSLDPRVSLPGRSEIHQRLCDDAFNDLDPESQGYIMFDKIDELIIKLKLTHLRDQTIRRFSNPEMGGIIIKSDALIWLTEKKAIAEPEVEVPSKKIMYFYDGQMCGSNARPTFRRFIVESTDLDSRFAQFDSADAQRILATRWPNCRVREISNRL